MFGCLVGISIILAFTAIVILALSFIIPWFYAACIWLNKLAIEKSGKFFNLEKNTDNFEL